MNRGTPRHRKLALWSALPPYLGGKRRLCPLIFREVDRVLPRRLWANLTFLDAFLGGGSVSLYAKAQGFRVVSTDIAERAIVVGDALVGNGRVRLRREDVLALLAPSDEPAGRIETKFAPSVFTREQARLLDRALDLAGKTTDLARSALLRLLAIRVALLAHPMAQVRSGTIHRLETGEYESITESCLGHYVDGMRLTRPDRLWGLAQHINAGVFAGEAQVLRRSVLEALPEIEADVAYFDPPYPGVMSYEKEYRVIDEILEGSSRATSPFTARDGADMIDTLFERALHVPVWVLSLGNAVVSLADLEAKMARLGRTTKAFEIRYQHLPAVATDEKKETNREFLVVGYDPIAVERLLGREAPQDTGGVDLDDLPGVLVHEDAGLRGPEGASAQSLPRNRLEQSETALGEQIALLGGAALPETEGGLNDPHSVVLKLGRASDGERS